MSNHCFPRRKTVLDRDMPLLKRAVDAVMRTKGRTTKAKAESLLAKSRRKRIRS